MPSQKPKALRETIQRIDREIDRLYRKRRKIDLFSPESAGIHDQLIALIDQRKRLTEELRLSSDPVRSRSADSGF